MLFNGICKEIGIMYHKIVVQECENFPSKCNKHTSLLYNLSSLTYNAQLYHGHCHCGTIIAGYTRITCEATDVSIHKTTWRPSTSGQTVHKLGRQLSKPNPPSSKKICTTRQHWNGKDMEHQNQVKIQHLSSQAVHSITSYRHGHGENLLRHWLWFNFPWCLFIWLFWENEWLWNLLDHQVAAERALACYSIIQLWPKLWKQ